MVKTFLLLAALTALFVVVGGMLGGEQGMAIALMFALATNAFAYWFSDSLVLKMHGAQPMDASRHEWLLSTIERLSNNAGIPVPKAYIMQNPQPNAFATGRSPSHAAVALTTGLLDTLTDDEIEGVIAHELAHIKHRDTLIMTVTATIAGAISALANFAMFFGHGRGERSNPLAGIAIAILAPFAAMIVQLAISRTREYGADRGGAEISGKPLALASALAKISQASKRIPNMAAENNPATAHLFISNPLYLRKTDGLFSTHPAPENRIQALQELAQFMGRSGMPSSANGSTAHLAKPRKGTFNF